MDRNNSSKFVSELLETTKQRKAKAFIDKTETKQRTPSKQLVKVKCERCSAKIIESQFVSHLSNHSSMILPYLYLGGERNAHNLIELTERTRIGYILNVSWESACKYPDRFEYKRIDISDHGDQDMVSILEDAVSFIEKSKNQGTNILVHCVQGISRSATVVAAYLMKCKGWTRDYALDYVKRCRPVVNPNQGFRDQLKQYEEMLGSRLDVEDEEIEMVKKENPMFRFEIGNGVIV